MGLVLVMVMLVGTVAVCGEEAIPRQVVDSSNTDVTATDLELADTELVLAFVVFRHGDRTPDDEELDLYPIASLPHSLYFPFGKKAITNKGKQRSFLVGKYLRTLYDGLISRLYLPDEITVRTTDYARTQMTVLTALSALYPPLPAQQWNPSLMWQPIPYHTPPFEEDDFMYWYNCPKYLKLRDTIYENPEMKKWIEPYQQLFKYLSHNTGTNITTPEGVFFLDNLFQTLNNVGVSPPKWTQGFMPKIKEVTKIEYAAQFFTAELIQLSSGVLMDLFLNKTNSAIVGPPPETKLYLFSGHENNVAAWMAAARVFEAHQPNYGATFSLQLRKNKLNDEYGITTIYSAEAGGPGILLPINGCGGQIFCNYDKFVALMQDILLPKEQYHQQCKL